MLCSTRRALKYAGVCVGSVMVKDAVFMGLAFGWLKFGSGNSLFYTGLPAVMLAAQIAAGIFNFTSCRFWIWGDLFKSWSEQAVVTVFKWVTAYLILACAETSVVMFLLNKFNLDYHTTYYMPVTSIRFGAFVTFTILGFAVNNQMVFRSVALSRVRENSKISRVA